MTGHPEVASTPNPDPGRILKIASRSYYAEIGTRGAALLRLVHNRRDLVVPTTEDLSVLSYSGRVLAPWPNRLRDGVYTWEGSAYRVPVNEPATNTALHGLLAWADFTVGAVSTPGVMLHATLDHPGYPTTLDLTVTYLLSDERGLSVAISATNTGELSAPYGVAGHPYLTCDGAPVDACTLTLPAGRVTRTGERNLPAAVEEVAGDLDLRAPRPFGPRQIDHAFTDLPGERWEARLEREDGFAVVLASTTRWAQVYSGEEIGRAGIAVEAMTCPPGAFVSGEDLVVLAPGEAHTYGYSIRAEEGR